MVLSYMKKSKKISPDLQKQAEYYVNSGYQQLLAFEVPGGGFQWCGHSPAVDIWTAYGLMLFHEMSQVHDVDPAILDRTKKALLAMQGQDGSWSGNLTTTAFIMYCLTESGFKDSSLANGINYIKQNLSDNLDAYTYALCVNALFSYDPSDSTAQKALQKLYNRRIEKGDIAYWPMKSQVANLDGVIITDLEPTALATYAFLKADKYSDTVNKAITYIIRAKSPNGIWASTQGTVLSLKALILSLGGTTEKVNGQADIFINGERVESFSITPEDYDVFRQFDLLKYTKTGKNNVEIKFQGEGSSVHRVIGKYYLPWKTESVNKDLSFALSYDRQKIKVDETVNCKATVKNCSNIEGRLVMVDAGVPPGFEVVSDNLQKMVDDQYIMKYELHPGRVVIYILTLKVGETKEITYQLKSKYPLKVLCPKSRAYLYYNPEVSTVVKPVTMAVE